LLRTWKGEVWCARTAEEATEIVESHTAMPNIVVADYRLPGKFDGVEAIQRIQLELQTAIPAIIVTGENDISNRWAMSFCANPCDQPSCAV
jgi:two-component system, sensor histidine kinase